MRPYFLRLLFVIFALVGMSAHATAGEHEFIVGFPEDNLSNDWRAAQMNEIKAEFAKHPNIKFLMADAGGSVAKNIADIEAMAEAGAQLLFLAPRNPDAVQLVVSRLRKQGMRIVLLTRKLNSEDYDTYISPDDFRIAYDAAIFLAEEIGGNGRILMLEGVPTTSTAIKRKGGFLAGLANYPGVHVVSRVANYSRSEAIRALEESIATGEKFDAIYAHNDAMAIGARTVLKANGIAPSSVPMVSIDFLPETREAIINGEQLASFTYPTCGKAGVAAAMDILNGKSVPRFIAIASERVTRDNVNRVHTVY